MKVIIKGNVIDLLNIYRISPIEFKDGYDWWYGYIFIIYFLNHNELMMKEGSSLKGEEKVKAFETITKLRNNLVTIWNDNKSELIEITS